MYRNPQSVDKILTDYSEGSRKLVSRLEEILSFAARNFVTIVE